MEKMKLLLGLSILILSTVLLSCNVESTLTEEDQNTTSNLLSNRSTRTSNLWEPMDSYRKWIWNKAVTDIQVLQYLV